MPLVLPAKRRVALPLDPEALGAALAIGCPDEGWLHVVHDRGESFLFLHKGRAFSAGAVEGGRLLPLELAAFSATVAHARELFLVEADLPLLLCAAVLFRRPPAARVPASLGDVEGVLRRVGDARQDAVVVVAAGELRTLAFFREGQPAALYPAPGAPSPAAGLTADGLLEVLYADPAAALELYDDVRVPPSPGAGLPPQAYLRAAQPTASADKAPVIVVRIGERVVTRFRLDKEEITIGRSDGVDLVLDNLSVSRLHARARRLGDVLVIEDLGSENGLIVRGQRVPVATLSAGDEVVVGRYTLVWTRYASGEEQAPVRRAPSPAETVTLVPDSSASLEHDGRRHAVRGIVFRIGRSDDANLKVGGLFVGDTHVAIVRDGDGFRARRLGPLRRLYVNGQPVAETRLQHGDVLTLAGERIVFRYEHAVQ